MNQFISGTFYDFATASEAVDHIIALGYAHTRMNIMMSNLTRRRLTEELPRGRATGTKGATHGGNLAKILAEMETNGNVTASLFATGPAAAALKAAGSGAGGSVLGALAGLGIPRHDCERLAHDIDSGAIVIGLNPNDDDRMAIQRVMRTTAAREVVENTPMR